MKILKSCHLVNFNNSINTVIPYTFKYDENGYNETIFKKFLWLDLEKYDDYSIFLEDAFLALDNKILNLKKIKNNLKEKNINYYLEKNLDENIFFLKYLKNILEIETEKIKKFEFKMEEDKLKKILNKNEKIEEKIFWEKISKNKDFSNEIISALEKEFLKNIENINSEEKFFLENIIKILRKKTKTENFTKNNFSEKKFTNNLKNFDNKILKKKIKREDYIEIFKLVIDILWLDFDVKIDENSGNISAWEDWLKIPLIEEYSELEIWRILDLISHEIETHLITLKNNEILACSVRSIWYQTKEEWIASTFWKLSSWKDLYSSKELLSTTDILIWEIFPWEILKKYLKVRKKLEKNKNLNVKKRFERLKRWKNFLLNWVNPKEKSYFIWRKEVIKRLENNENILNLFLWRNSFNFEKDLLKIVWNTNDFKNLKEKNLVFPMMIWAILRYKLLNSWEKYWNLWFFKYFNETYGNIFQKNNIDYKNFIKYFLIKEEKKENKSRISLILDIFQK